MTSVSIQQVTASSIACASRSRVIQRIGLRALPDLRPFRQVVSRTARPGDDVVHGIPARDQRVGDESPVAAPRDCFRAQERDGFGFRLEPHPRQRFFEFVRLHVVRVTAKGSASPPGVFGVREGAASPSQPFQVQITDPAFAEEGLQPLLVEMGKFVGAGEAADVDDEIDVVQL